MEGSPLLAPMCRLEGKVAVITGGASGIGETTAWLFAHHGAKVVIGDVQDNLAQSVCESINNSIESKHISFVHCDVTSDSDVQNLVDATIDKHGKLDIMFSNAGITDATTPITGISYEDFRRVFDVNVFGALVCAKHAARVMIPAKRGSIVFTSSLASVSFTDDVSHIYSASKAAIVALTKNLCVEMGKHGIRVNCISPFGLATPFSMKITGASDKKDIEDFLGSVANLKGVTLGTVDVAQAVLYLASDEAKYVSGLNLVLDGGYSTTNVALSEALKKPQV